MSPAECSGLLTQFLEDLKGVEAFSYWQHALDQVGNQAYNPKLPDTESKEAFRIWNIAREVRDLGKQARDIRDRVKALNEFFIRESVAARLQEGSDVRR
jgi:hypothetical protein